MTDNTNQGRVYLEKIIEEGKWKIIAWVLLDEGGEISYKFTQHIADKSGNNLTIKKHGKKDIICCNKKMMISSFDIKNNERHKLAEFEIEVFYQGEKLGSDSVSIILNRTAL